MVLVIENQSLLERKHFLLRGIYNGNVDEKEAEIEIAKLQTKIDENLQARLLIEKKKLVEAMALEKEEMNNNPTTERELLLSYLSYAETKSIFRQGYHMLRYNEFDVDYNISTKEDLKKVILELQSKNTTKIAFSKESAKCLVRYYSNTKSLDQIKSMFLLNYNMLKVHK